MDSLISEMNGSDPLKSIQIEIVTSQSEQLSTVNYFLKNSPILRKFQPIYLSKIWAIFDENSPIQNTLSFSLFVSPSSSSLYPEQKRHRSLHQASSLTSSI
jgi:hypothetical protein